MTREELFRAVGEVREDQIEAAEAVKERVRPWRRIGVPAACLALLVTAAAAVPRIGEELEWKAIVSSFNPAPAVTKTGTGGDAGGGADGLDGTLYWTDGPGRPILPSYSEGVEIGQLGARYGGAAGYMALDTAWLSQEELFAQDTDIFRGRIRELQYFCVDLEGAVARTYYTRAIVEVTDPIRGDLSVGETVSILWLGASPYMTTSLSGPLDRMGEGSDAVFMPVQTTPETGRRDGGSYFCYADLAGYYLSEGARYVFLRQDRDGSSVLDFDRDAYPALAGAGTMEELAARIREQIGEQEQIQREAMGEQREKGLVGAPEVPAPAGDGGTGAVP